MVKMEFLKRKHFSLWIIVTFVLVVVSNNFDAVNALQGVPTWICLGIKSPFIEFSNDLEVLANNSIPLNITKDEQALMHQEGLRKLGTFIKPVDLRDSETGYVKANHTKKIPSMPPRLQAGQRRLHPIQEEMDQKQIILLDEDTDENGLPASLTDEDRKFIVPMALKNAQDPRMTSTTYRTPITRPPTTTTTRAPTTTRRLTTPATPEFASNIDDLKRHILFLQNLTKHDSNFQSKFVVFPSLQKDKTSPATTMRPMRPIFQFAAPITPPTSKLPSGFKTPLNGQPFGGYYHNQDEETLSSFLAPANPSGREKISIVPQVLLLNDQTAANGKKRLGGSSGNSSAAAAASTTTTTTSTTTTTTTTRKPTKRPPCLRNPDSPKCIRQRKREEQERARVREQLLREQAEYLLPRYEPWVQTINNTKRFAVSIEIPDSFKIPLNESDSSSPPVGEEGLQVLSRFVRSPGNHKRRNIGGGLPGRSASSISASVGDKFYGASGFLERDVVMSSSSGGRDFLMEQFGLMGNTSTPSPTVALYSEPIDLNPDNCYLVDGMTYGQKKQCVLHTSVMPAISRGARASIQECQYQFKNRRWNCSTTDDNTVFGPMTGLGSPEMAFIHALAAATVTSFIARACRDGQLASCGCSRGSRPKQLHDDWNWGGCGDNLEYAYKFATDFIDIREKETRRGTRGVGNPERKRSRMHQRRNRLMQAMQGDDANAIGRGRGSAGVKTTSLKTTATTQRTTTTAAAGTSTVMTTTMKSIKEKQQNSNKTVNTGDGDDDQTNGEPRVQTEWTTTTTTTTTKSPPTTTTKTAAVEGKASTTTMKSSSVAPPKQEESSEEYTAGGIKPEDLLELQERITKEILNSKLQEKEMLELQEKINREILNSKVFNLDSGGSKRNKRKRKNQRAVNAGPSSSADEDDYGPGSGGFNGGAASGTAGGKWKNGASPKARSLMNLHNNEAGRRAVIKKTRITCKCHGVSGSCSLITCWQQLSSIREIGDYLREKYEEATEVKLNKRGRLQVKDPQFKVPTAHDLVYLDESPDWCRSNRQLQWPGTHGRVCNKTSSGLDGCGILCCGRGYNTKNIVVRERCNCKFFWCCEVKCDVCVKVLEEHTCK